MLREWSSPTRVDESGNPLPLLPNELYEEILSPIRSDGSPQDKYRVSLTCRYFCYLMLPHVLNTLTFDRSCSSRRPRGPDCFAYCDALANNKGQARKIAKHVHRCHFWEYPAIGRLPNEFQPYMGLLPESFAMALGFMENTTELTFSRCVITVELVHVLPQFKQLKSLAFLHIETFGLYTKEYNILSTLRLSRLSMRMAGLQFAIDLATAFDYTSLTSLVSWVPASVRALESAGDWLPLRELELTMAKCHITNSSFRWLRELRKLSLGSFAEDALNEVVKLQPSDLPNLEELECTAGQLHILAPGRPLTKVTLKLGNQHENRKCPRTLFKTLSQTSRPIEELTIPVSWFLNYMGSFDHLLSLQHLTLVDESNDNLEEGEKLLRRICIEFPSFPEVQSIRAIHQYTYGPRRLQIQDSDIDKQRQILSTIPSGRGAPFLVIQLGRIHWSRRVGVWSADVERNS
ncbi:hypothetical protein DFP72DRAFT_933225 [Ephemerocybe angulata]|uniref:F-box domain-containing protein n=1 Tax=Ephemerocybe angulata TaxID=980116 RepID=A0A8H6LUT3_9AGAR|nr:hypothetical protein DFP72DRAFT_933225 [Tulosesus angulatus]